MLRRGSFGASHGRYCPVRLVTVVVTVPARFWSRLASSLNGIPSPPKRAGTLIYRGILDTLSLSVFLGPNRLGGLAKARVAGSNPVSRSNSHFSSARSLPISFSTTTVRPFRLESWPAFIHHLGRPDRFHVDGRTCQPSTPFFPAPVHTRLSLSSR